MRISSAKRKAPAEAISSPTRKAPAEACGSDDPFHDESQEGQLNTWRSDIRSHGKNEGVPPFIAVADGGRGEIVQAVGLDDEIAHLLSREPVPGSAVGDGVKQKPFGVKGEGGHQEQNEVE